MDGSIDEPIEHWSHIDVNIWIPPPIEVRSYGEKNRRKAGEKEGVQRRKQRREGGIGETERGSARGGRTP